MGCLLSTRSEVAQEFLQTILGPVPQDSCIEIRHKKNADKIARQKFLAQITQLDLSQFDTDEHVWFGVVLRKVGSTAGKYEDLSWATCVWADFDNVTDKDGVVARLKKFDVPATAIVDSGGGIHAYWRLNRMLNMQDESQRAYVREVVYGLAHVLGADTTVHDPTRVLRVPETFNVGNGKKKVYDPPRKATILALDPTLRHAVEDLSRFRRSLQPAVIASLPVVPPAVTPSGPLSLDKINVVDRLRNLIRDGWSAGCGYPSRSELDEAVAIAMLRGGHSAAEITGVFNDPTLKIGEKMREKAADGPRYLGVTIQSAQDWIARTDSRMPEIRESGGHIQTRGPDGKWRDVFDRLMKVLAKLTGEVSGYRVEIPQGPGFEPERRTLTADSMSSNVRFKEALSLAGAWLGTDRDVQMLIPYFNAQKPPLRRAVKTIGWTGDEVIFPRAHLLADGTLATQMDYLYIGEMDDAELQDSNDWNTLAGEIFKHLPRLHAPEKIAPIIGWYMASFAAPQIRSISFDGAFPILMVFGVKESGKTNTLEIMQRLAGWSKSPAQCNDTKFVNVKHFSSSNTLPWFLDEHRREFIKDYKYTLYPLLRSAYQAELMARGQPNLTVQKYRLTTPIVIAGETSFRDPALLDRTVHVEFEQMGKNEGAFNALKKLGPSLLQFNAGMYRHIKTKDVAKLFAEAESLLPSSVLNNPRARRQAYVWTVVATGLLLTEPYIPRAEIEKMIAALGAVNNVSAAATPHARIVLQEVLRIILELMRSRRIRDGMDYCIRSDGTTHTLWIIPAIVMPAIEEYVQRFPSELPLSKENLLAVMRADSKDSAPLVRKYQDTFRNASGKTARGIAFDLEQVEIETGIPAESWMQSAILHAEAAP